MESLVAEGRSMQVNSTRPAVAADKPPVRTIGEILAGGGGNVVSYARAVDFCRRWSKTLFGPGEPTKRADCENDMLRDMAKTFYVRGIDAIIGPEDDLEKVLSGLLEIRETELGPELTKTRLLVDVQGANLEPDWDAEPLMLFVRIERHGCSDILTIHTTHEPAIVEGRARLVIDLEPGR
jgi:hypothetical protein